MLGLKEDDYKGHQGYQACLPGDAEELKIKIGEGKLRRQETQDSAFSDEPIIRWAPGEQVRLESSGDLLCYVRNQNRRARFGQQETLEADYLDHDYDCPDLDLNKPS